MNVVYFALYVVNIPHTLQVCQEWRAVEKVQGDRGYGIMEKEQPI